MKPALSLSLQEDFCLFAAPHDPEAIDAARAYVRSQNLTSEDVRIVRRADQVLVLTKRTIPWR